MMSTICASVLGIRIEHYRDYVLSEIVVGRGRTPPYAMRFVRMLPVFARYARVSPN